MDALTSLLAATRALPSSARCQRIKSRIMAEPRVVDIHQALLVTQSYQATAGQPAALRRAAAFRHCCEHLPIRIGADELIVGNRTPGVRSGVVFPEASVGWIDRELESLPTRPQDPFAVTAEQIATLRREVFPYWKGQTLEDTVYGRFDAEIMAAATVVKINQRDHAQGHIIPDLSAWLRLGPAGLQAQAEAGSTLMHQSAAVSLAGARTFMRRYAEAARQQIAGVTPERASELADIAQRCHELADRPPRTFAEAVQATWFLFTLLHLESNASSFSPGRLDQAWAPFLDADLADGKLDRAQYNAARRDLERELLHDVGADQDGNSGSRARGGRWAARAVRYAGRY